MTLDELLATRPNAECDWMEPEEDGLFRTKGISYWHWGYCLDGVSYAFYNTKEQARLARVTRLAKR